MAELVSILIRSRNDEAYIGETLKAIFDQKCPLPFEVISCDDASTDRTPEIIASFPSVRSLPRPEGVYMPGARLNYMVKPCRGDIVVFNNADAVFGNQLPRADAHYLVRKDNLRAFGDGKIAKTWRFFFSLATSAIPRDELLKHPFDESMRYSEDVECAPRRPIRIVYAADAVVEHSHNYTLSELKQRFYGEGYADGRIFGDRPALMRELAAAAMETLRDTCFLLKHPGGLAELPLAPVRRFIQKFWPWNGVRDYGRDTTAA